MVSTITLRSTSREEDAALAALADLAQAVVDWESCRVVGGHMVTIHVVLAGTDARHRPTADADLAASVAVLGEPEFAERLKAIGYEKVDGSRLSRATEHGEAFIDLIAPAPASRAPHNQPAGQFRVDKFPGIQYALNQPAVVVDVEAVPLDGPHYDPYRVVVPTLAAAIVIKSLAARTRQKDKDDVLRLLAVANDTGIALPRPPYDNLDIRRAAEYLQGPFLSGASQDTRALVDRAVPRPPERPAFANL